MGVMKRNGAGLRDAQRCIVRGSRKVA